MIDEKVVGKMGSILVPGDFLLGTRLGRWYSQNSYHKWEEGDILILRDRRSFGFGIRLVVVVEKYDFNLCPIREREGTYSYVVTRYTDLYDSMRCIDVGDQVGEWCVKNEVPQGVERVVLKQEIHFKWNMEYLFRRVCVEKFE